jgi:hypothetical protein
MALIDPSPHLFKAGDTGIYCEYCGRAEGAPVHLSAVHAFRASSSNGVDCVACGKPSDHIDHQEAAFHERVEINHPPHYTAHPSGVECIQITEHMSFNLGNAVKYVWRADLKDSTEDDLRKAAWYIQREMQRRGYEPGDDQ